MADDAGILDPQISSQPSGFALVRITQRGLMAFPPAGPAAPAPTPGAPVPTVSETAVPVPDLAEAPPQRSSDGRVVTFRLRPGIAFGAPANRPVRSGDVKAGIERLFRVQSPLRAYFSVIAGAAELAAGRATTMAGIETPDDRTIRFRLSRPANDLEWMLAHTAASAVPAGTGPAISPDQLPASGPYRVERATPGREIRLVRNAAWKQQSDPVRKAWPDAIRVQVGSAARADSTRADITGEQLPAPPGTSPVVVDGGCLLYLFLSPRDARLSARNARAAIAVAVDRAAVARVVAATDPGVGATPASAVLAPGSVGAVPPDVAPADPAKARSLLPKGFDLPLGRESSGADAAVDQAVVAALTPALASAGVRVTPVRALPPASIYDRYATGTVPAGIARWCPDWPGRSGRTVLSSLMGSRGHANYAGVTDPALDALIEAATTADPGAVQQRWRAAEARALSLVTVVPLAFLREVVPVSDRVGGFAPHSFLIRGDLAAVWLKGDGARDRPVD